MRFNKYTLKINNGDNTILYNLITKMMISVDCSISNIDSILNEDNIDSEYIEMLKDGLILSDNDNDDYEEFINIKNYYNNSNYIGRFMIHLGYNCNLSCSYCYQETISKCNYNLDTKKIIEFIIYSTKINKYKVLDICFIGGEPLIYYKEIENISRSLNSIYRNDMSVKIVYSVVTNGTLLNNSKIIDILLCNGIKDLQVTVDGCKQIHDKLRYYKNKRGSFDRIMSNIKNINDKYKGIDISINCNISNINGEYMKEFLDYLKNNGINNKLFFSLVFDTSSSNKYELDKKSNYWYKVHKLAIEYGYDFEPFYRDMYLGCAMTQKHYHIIGADGNLYKCINSVNNEKYFLSSISEYNSYGYQKKSKEFFDYKINKNMCELCNLYPICYGGCDYTNSINGFKCDYEYYINNDIKIIREIFNARNKRNKEKV